MAKTSLWTSLKKVSDRSYSTVSLNLGGRRRWAFAEAQSPHPLGGCRRRFARTVLCDWYDMTHGEAREGNNRGYRRMEWVSNQRHTAAEQNLSSNTTNNKNITHATQQHGESELRINIKELVSTSLLPYTNYFRSYRNSNKMACWQRQFNCFQYYSLSL
jgi:hypothetical protein